MMVKMKGDNVGGGGEIKPDFAQFYIMSLLLFVLISVKTGCRDDCCFASEAKGATVTATGKFTPPFPIVMVHTCEMKSNS